VHPRDSRESFAQTATLHNTPALAESSREFGGVHSGATLNFRSLVRNRTFCGNIEHRRHQEKNHVFDYYVYYQ
jgi:hypothetical protein